MGWQAGRRAMDFWSKEFSGANIATEGLHRILEGLCGIFNFT